VDRYRLRSARSSLSMRRLRHCSTSLLALPQLNLRSIALALRPPPSSVATVAPDRVRRRALRVCRPATPTSERRAGRDFDDNLQSTRRPDCLQRSASDRRSLVPVALTPLRAPSASLVALNHVFSLRNGVYDRSDRQREAPGQRLNANDR